MSSVSRGRARRVSSVLCSSPTCGGSDYRLGGTGSTTIGKTDKAKQSHTAQLGNALPDYMRTSGKNRSFFENGKKKHVLDPFSQLLSHQLTTLTWWDIRITGQSGRVVPYCAVSVHPKFPEPSKRTIKKKKNYIISRSRSRSRSR